MPPAPFRQPLPACLMYLNRHYSSLEYWHRPSASASPTTSPARPGSSWPPFLPRRPLAAGSMLSSKEGLAVADVRTFIEVDPDMKYRPIPAKVLNPMQGKLPMHLSPRCGLDRSALESRADLQR